MVLEEYEKRAYWLVEGLPPCALCLKRRKVNSLWCDWVPFLCSTLLLIPSPRADKKSSEALISVGRRARGRCMRRDGRLCQYAAAPP